MTAWEMLLPLAPSPSPSEDEPWSSSRLDPRATKRRDSLPSRTSRVPQLGPSSAGLDIIAARLGRLEAREAALEEEVKLVQEALEQANRRDERFKLAFKELDEAGGE